MGFSRFYCFWGRWETRACKNVIFYENHASVTALRGLEHVKIQFIMKTMLLSWLYRVAEHVKPQFFMKNMHQSWPYGVAEHVKPQFSSKTMLKPYRSGTQEHKFHSGPSKSGLHMKKQKTKGKQP